MEHKELYLLAQFDEEAQNTMAGYYENLQQYGFVGTQTKGIPYHFTLGSCAAEREKAMIEALERVCAETNCIELRLDHIGLFGSNVIFIEPSMSEGLLRLPRCFFEGAGGADFRWTPHATLLIDEPEAIYRAIPMVAQNFEPFSAKIVSVGLYEFFPTRFICECGLK